MSTLAEFLAARFDEDEAVARSAAGSSTGHWARGSHAMDECAITGDDEMTIYDEGGHNVDDAIHIVRWDPARVLAEVAAKRAILAEIEQIRGPAGFGCDRDTAKYIRDLAVALEATLQALASVYADHPDYRSEWAS